MSKVISDHFKIIKVITYNVSDHLEIVSNQFEIINDYFSGCK